MIRLFIALLAVAQVMLVAPSAEAKKKKTEPGAPIWLGGERFPAPGADAPRVLLIGDSNFFGPLGHSLRKTFMQRGYHVRIRGKPSSGLARPEFFDWFVEAQRLIDEVHPDLVIAMLGANDVQRLTWPRLGDRIQWSEEPLWRRAYAGRYREFARFLAARVPEVVLLSPTNRGWENAREAVTRVRQEQARAVRGLAGVHWVDMFPLSSNPDGSWLRCSEDTGAKRIWYRHSDRIHLTRDGGKLVGARLIEAFRGLGLGLIR